MSAHWAICGRSALGRATAGRRRCAAQHNGEQDGAVPTGAPHPRPTADHPGGLLRCLQMTGQQGLRARGVPGQCPDCMHGFIHVCASSGLAHVSLGGSRHWSVRCPSSSRRVGRGSGPGDAQQREPFLRLSSRATVSRCMGPARSRPPTCRRCRLAASGGGWSRVPRRPGARSSAKAPLWPQAQIHPSPPGCPDLPRARVARGRLLPVQLGGAAVQTRPWRSLPLKNDWMEARIRAGRLTGP